LKLIYIGWFVLNGIAMNVDEYVNFIENKEHLSPEDQRNICIKIKNAKTEKEKIEYKNILITSNLKLVVKIAKFMFKPFENTNIDIMDLIAEGNIGLMVAAEKYDPDNESGANFTTYAYNIIKTHIIRAIKKFRLIKLTRSYFSLNSKMKLKSDEEILKELNMSEEELNSFKNTFNQQFVYLDDLDYDVNEKLLVCEEEFSKKWDHEKIRKILNIHLNKLTEKQKIIIDKLYLADETKTLEQIAKNFGASKQSAFSNKLRILKKLRRSLLADPNMKEIKQYFGIK
jgi:RNA polymerase sigma factor (sigma-70 family)